METRPEKIHNEVGWFIIIISSVQLLQQHASSADY